MSDSALYLQSTHVATTTETLVTWSRRQPGSDGGTTDKIASRGSTDSIVVRFLAGANAIHVRPYGFMGRDEALAVGVPLATATAISAGTYGAVTIDQCHFEFYGFTVDDDTSTSSVAALAVVKKP